MKIKDNSKKNLVMFGDVKRGSVIRTKDDKVFIKVETLCVESIVPTGFLVSCCTDTDIYGPEIKYETKYNPVNAISLVDGKGCYILGIEEVEVFENSYVSME